MDCSICFHDGSITDLINSRTLHNHNDFNHVVQMHSSLVRRLSLERELEGHRGCVNTIAWNSEGSMLISGSDDTQARQATLGLNLGEGASFGSTIKPESNYINLLHNTFSFLLSSFVPVKFVPPVNLLNIRMVMPAIEYHGCLIFCRLTSGPIQVENLWTQLRLDILPIFSVQNSSLKLQMNLWFLGQQTLSQSDVSALQVRLFNLSRLRRNGLEGSSISPSAVFRCHTRRVKKLAVEPGNPNLVWSASEDGTFRQHDFREGSSCPPAGSSHQECRNVLLDLRCGAKKSLADPPKQPLALKSCDISSTRPHLVLVGGSDAFARLYDRRMLPPLSSSQNKLPPPPCVDYFCPMHLSDLGHSSLHPTHVAFSPNGEELLVNYSGEHVYLMDVNNGMW
ncbi:hypothetical protein SASPL_118589 [Salvia splendens]|uniref:Uncharacterized protein n=1 Tax=Salvia splendens TaxID=180675 RepID=A0A8X8Y1Y3_SALSN|nr:hypothetical protein SASPL_118589 [Salvia splendens]